MTGSRNTTGTVPQTSIASYQPSKLENDAGMKIIEQRDAVDTVPLAELITDGNESISKQTASTIHSAQRPTTPKNGLSDGDSNPTRRKRQRTRLSTGPDSKQSDESFHLPDMFKPAGQEGSLALSKISESRGSSPENDVEPSKKDRKSVV